MRITLLSFKNVSTCLCQGVSEYLICEVCLHLMIKLVNIMFPAILSSGRSFCISRFALNCYYSTILLHCAVHFLLIFGDTDKKPFRDKQRFLSSLRDRIVPRALRLSNTSSDLSLALSCHTQPAALCSHLLFLLCKHHFPPDFKHATRVMCADRCRRSVTFLEYELVIAQPAV